MIALGDRVSLQLKQGRWVRAPARGALLYDPEGRDWPSCSLLVAGFEELSDRGGGAAQSDEFIREWFGDDYAPIAGQIKLPPRNLSDWKLVGRASRIRFDRAGEYSPGPKEHPFGERLSGVAKWLLGGASWQKGKDAPLVYKYKQALRIELGQGCVLTRAGIEHP